MLFAVPLAVCVVASVSAFISGTTIPAVPESEALYWPCPYAVPCVHAIIIIITIYLMLCFLPWLIC